MTHAFTKAAMVWNRGMSEYPDGGVGDRHLRAMANPYAQIMGSGVSAVMDTSSAEEVRQAANAFDYFGLPDLANLTRRLIDTDWPSEDGLEQRLNRNFWGLEFALHGAFERKYAESPEDFDAVIADGVDRLSGSWPSGDGKDIRACSGELIVSETEIVLAARCVPGD